jgi:hypothetical protein
MQKQQPRGFLVHMPAWPTYIGRCRVMDCAAKFPKGRVFCYVLCPELRFLSLSKWKRG